MIDRGEQVASLRLTPENLGPLDVRIAVREGETTVWFGASHPETRAALEQGENDKVALQAEIAQRDVALKESLEEEERLATDLETAHQSASNLRKAADALRQERDTLSRQVADLTKERAELLEARRALEAVHRALAHAVSR